MLYRVFNNETEVSEANARWIEARHNAGITDKKLGVCVEPQITNAWDSGKIMLDGRIACLVPTMFSDEFGGLESELTSEDFPAIEEEGD